MNSALRRLLVPLLRSVSAGKPISFRMKSAAGQALFLVQRKPSPSRKKPAAQRKEVKRALHREETGAIREAVFARAKWRCEVAYHGGICGEPATEMDHWLGGNGRRRQQQSVETCWALCRRHHEARTLNIDGTEFWNERFRLHCNWHGYSFTPHIVHASLRPAPAAPPTPPSGERSGAGQEASNASARSAFKENP